jgi:hypothetical protein
MIIVIIFALEGTLKERFAMNSQRNQINQLQEMKNRWQKHFWFASEQSNLIIFLAISNQFCSIVRSIESKFTLLISLIRLFISDKVYKKWPKEMLN